eukprot:CAMPEP_0201942486 /NCGR_PEP_ID=MMETSP0903-20130614/49119_1 /ASSEMBLY_ACC=CAM_ASM_000552 /TAXON_ID=420261 /ORGANISM="Thalassiosira antarctica, Strain CCMP982" /LENGTH=178 /DNA_ID=CAMNT_0048484887 /DNA_START=53 /DNA_END=586 /DNA_ORIENTATION=+
MTRFNSFATFTVISLLSWQPCAGFSNTNINNHRVRSCLHNAPEGDGGGAAMDRRGVLGNICRAFPIAVTAAFSMSAATLSPTPALALDFDAFEARETSKDSGKSNPKLNDDEALCKFGSPGKSMGEACERAKMKPKLPANVDAFGKIDRGDYLKCVYEYPVINNQYVKTRVCKPSGEW